MHTVLFVGLDRDRLLVLRRLFFLVFLLGRFLDRFLDGSLDLRLRRDLDLGRVVAVRGLLRPRLSSGSGALSARDDLQRRRRLRQVTRPSRIATVRDARAATSGS